MRPRVMAFCCALFLTLGDVSAGNAAASKSGWWVRVNTSQTEASTIVFQIGTSERDRRHWRVWKSSEPAEFEVPAEFAQVADLYLHATSNPNDKNAWFCVFYRDAGVRHFDFDDVEDATMAQSDRDDECNY